MTQIIIVANPIITLIIITHLLTTIITNLNVTNPVIITILRHITPLLVTLETTLMWTLVTDRSIPHDILIHLNILIAIIKIIVTITKTHITTKNLIAVTIQIPNCILVDKSNPLPLVKLNPHYKSNAHRSGSQTDYFATSTSTTPSPDNAKYTSTYNNFKRAPTTLPTLQTLATHLNNK